MAKTKISEFSTTAGNNTDINSINIAEGCSPSGINAVSYTHLTLPTIYSV